MNAIDVARSSILSDLNAFGAAVVPSVLSAGQCHALGDLCADSTLPKTPSVAEQSDWGAGTYRRLTYPMPEVIAGLRSAFYSHLAPIANGWNERMESRERFPKALPQFLKMCRDVGQTLPTSMFMEHVAGEQTFLHRDSFGGLRFPLQAVVLLSQPGTDFEGGEFVITEQRPRMQTRAEVVALDQGDAVVLAVSDRPAMGARGTYRVLSRYGFSKIREGRQRALCINFHDTAA